MCGIHCIISKRDITSKYIKNIKKKLKHRGPDESGYVQFKCMDYLVTLIHTKLYNNSFDTQPIVNKERDIFLIIDGTIFNYQDNEIIPLYEQCKDPDIFLNKLIGQFSFILIDMKINRLFASRDHIGIIPMYYSNDNNEMILSSEIKTFSNKKVNIFPPKTYIHELITNFNPIFINFECKYDNLNELLELQIKELFNGKTEFGFILNSPIDKMIIDLAITLSKKYNYTKKMKIFSYCESLSHESLSYYNFKYTIKECIDNLQNCIYSIESYNVDVIRMNIPLFLLVKKIKLIFPNLKILFTSGGVRTFNYASAFGVELRFPCLIDDKVQKQIDNYSYLIELGSEMYTNHEFKERIIKYTIDVPNTYEELLYRDIFNKYVYLQD